ncbi:MAG: hypothetical protein WBM02_03045 [bacterium]
MANKTNLRCEGSVTAVEMRRFLSLPTTISPESYKKHWAKLPDTEIRVLAIQETQFFNAVLITAKAADAYDLFENLTETSIKSCKYLFAKWKDGNFNVEFWITDRTRS